MAREFNVYEFARSENLTIDAVHNSLKILAQNGYMTLSGERENSARLMFCVSREELYDYRIRRGEMEGVLLAVMRLYEGVFTEFRPIDVQEIALHSGYSVDKVREELKHLWRQHIIRYVPSSYSPILTLLSDRVPESDLYIAPESYLYRKESAVERMEAMMNYALLGDGCRSGYIQEYFGEVDATDCGVCDLCLARKKRRGGADGEVTPDRVLEVIAAKGGLSPRDLVREFSAEPESVVRAVEKLMESEKIYTDRGGILRTKE
jgi:ATP-dependent DNA helicase RecQ